MPLILSRNLKVEGIYGLLGILKLAIVISKLRGELQIRKMAASKLPGLTHSLQSHKKASY